MTKKHLLFLAAASAVSLMSCNKEKISGGHDVIQDSAITDFVVSLPKVSTRSVENPQNGGSIAPFYNDVTVYLVDGGDNIKGYNWTDDEIKAGAKYFNHITTPASVIVIVNKGNASLPSAGTKTALTEALAKIDISEQNKDAKVLEQTDNKGNEAGTYLSVQQAILYGETSSFQTQTAEDNVTTTTATVKLSSPVSRFEAGTLKAGTGLDRLTVDAVYINNFYNEYGKNTAQSYSSETWPDSFAPAWATDNGNSSVTSSEGTKAYAYQLYAGDLAPHIIYKVSGTVSEGYKLADGTQGDFSGKYITISVLKSGADAISSIKANYIYKVGLSGDGIEITPENIDSNPEKDKVNLSVTVTVADWTEEMLTPEI